MAYKNFYLKKHDQGRTFRKGFTIIELITVITIFSILASVALFNFAGFTDAINLSNLAQQVAIYVKKAQTSGSLGKVPPGIVLPVGWKPTYGTRFSTNNFCYFADVDSNGTDDNCTGERVEQINLAGSYQFSNRCVKLPGLQTCSSFEDLRILFRRPNLGAIILGPGSDINDSNTWGECAEITIQSPKGKQKKIIVRQVGQISTSGNCVSSDIDQLQT